jgi:LysR family glycine cleavage system transcriptional activator
MLILRNPLLEAFSAVAKLGTTHAAADELGITQTALTQRVKALEAGLEASLFLRSRRGMASQMKAELCCNTVQVAASLRGNS